MQARVRIEKLKVYPFEVWKGGRLRAAFKNASLAYMKADQLDRAQELINTLGSV